MALSLLFVLLVLVQSDEDTRFEVGARFEWTGFCVVPERSHYIFLLGNPDTYTDGIEGRLEIDHQFFDFKIQKRPGHEPLTCTPTKSEVITSREWLVKEIVLRDQFPDLYEGPALEKATIKAAQLLDCGVDRLIIISDEQLGTRFVKNQERDLHYSGVFFFEGEPVIKDIPVPSCGFRHEAKKKGLTLTYLSSLEAGGRIDCCVVFESDTLSMKMTRIGHENNRISFEKALKSFKLADIKLSTLFDGDSLN